MIALEIGNKTFDLPENWGEILSLKKYLDVVEVLYTHTGEQRLQALMQMLNTVCGVNGYDLGIAFNKGNAKQRNELANELSSFVAMQFYEEVFPVLAYLFELPDFEDNPIPSIKVGKLKLHGPRQRMEKQTGAEMEQCGWAYGEFIKTGEEQYLDKLIAAMYRPRLFYWIGPVRSYSAIRADKMEKTIAALHPIVKRGILLYYEACEHWWYTTYEDLYEGAGGEPGEIDSLSNSRIVRALAGNKRGTVEQVRQMTRDEIYFELSELERERRELEK